MLIKFSMAKKMQKNGRPGVLSEFQHGEQDATKTADQGFSLNFCMANKMPQKKQTRGSL